MSVLTEPKRQIAAAIESVEGTAESLTASNAKHLVLDRDLSYQDEIEMHQRDIVQSSFSKWKSLAGVEGARISCTVELRGSGSVSSPSSDFPSWDTLIRPCGFGRTALSLLAVGTITGTFTHGETVTGGTSSATGRVIGKWTGSDGLVMVEVTSGTFQSGETLTGGTSSASATTSAGPTAGGWAYEPISSSIPSATVAMYHDGVKKAIVGARGNLSLKGSVGEPAMLSFDFGGVYVPVADVALLSSITYETTQPPVLKNTTLAFDSFTPIVNEFSLDMGSTLALRRSMAATRGAVSTRLTDRRPTATFDPELDLVANFDFYGRKLGETLHYTEMSIGSTAGNRFKLIFPETQIESVDPSDRDRLSAVTLGVSLTGNSSYQDGEVVLLVY